MTRLNLTETCLLEVSGELGAKAHDQLREHIAKFPAAQLEYEVIKGQFELLRSMPAPVLSEDDKRRMASNIKQGIHRKLREQERQHQARKRWQLTYKALACISAAAACIVVAVSIHTVNSAVEEKATAARISSVRNYVDSLNNSGTENDTDLAIRNVAADIDQLQIGSPTLVSSHSNEMSNLLEVLSNVPAQDETPPTPGSL